MTSLERFVPGSPIINVSDGATQAWDKDGNVVELNDSLITQEMNKLKTEYDAQDYARKRKAEYNALNQFELISDDSINGTTTHKDAIVAIKTKYPKPE